MEHEKYDIPTATASIVKSSINGPPTYGANMPVDQKKLADERWRSDLEQFWLKVREQAGDNYPEAIQHLDLVGAREGFKNPATGHQMKIDKRASSLLTVLG